MPAATVLSVRSRIAGMLHRNDGEAGLEDFWDGIIPGTVQEEEIWLRQALAGFGDTAIAQSPMFEHYHRKLSVLQSLIYDVLGVSDDQRTLLQGQLDDLRKEIIALETIGDDPDSTADDAVQGGLMERDDDLFRRPGVNAGGSLAGDIFNTAPTWTHWR